MANGIIPDKLHDFNVYSNANKLIGIEQEIPFRTLYEDMFSLMSPLDAVDITLRGAIQTIDTNNHRDDVGVRVVERGQFKKFTPGTMQQGRRWMPP